MRRFDTDLMQPPTPGSAVDPSLIEPLQDWCERGALPRMTSRIDVARITSPDGLDAAACELDGSDRLVRLGRWLGLAWRLKVAVADRSPRRASSRDDPWDCGWWREGPLAAATVFRPRRATLLLVRRTEPRLVDGLIAALVAESAAYSKPLRILVVSNDPRSKLPLMPLLPPPGIRSTSA